MDKFVERAKEKVLYSFEGGSDAIRLMVSWGEANSRVNQEMARYQLGVSAIDSNWKGKYQGLISSWNMSLELAMMNLNGYSREQAINMAGQQSVAAREVIEPKERKGLLGLFSGK